MSLESKYEQFYRDSDDVCGDPFVEFSEFAKTYSNPSAAVLDLGCGQGRDALVFAGLGMAVTGVDTSPTGIQQMLAAGQSRKLRITGVVADIRHFDTDSSFDIVVLDRTLHILSDPADRLSVIARCASWLNPNGHILLADEPSNLPAMVEWFEKDSRQWRFTPNMKSGFCFVQRFDG